ncbi:MAG: YitT family protein [Cellulosilyticaceae bacterium]
MMEQQMGDTKHKRVKSYASILLGSLSVAIGLYFFWAPSQLAAGGVSGLAIVTKQLLPFVPIGVIILCLDVVMFTIGFLVLGKSFGIKSIISSLSISLYMMVLEWIWPVITPLSHDNLVVLIFGALLIALGQSIIFSQGGSSGGTDIVAKIINKFTHINIGVSLMMADLVVVVLAVTVFGIEKGLYAALGVMITSTMIDYLISGFNVEKYMMIIPSDAQHVAPIKQFILDVLERGATLYEAEGAYSGERKMVITTVVGQREFVQIKMFVLEQDENAFVTVQNLHEVCGEGFKKR